MLHILSWRNRIELSCIEYVIDLEDWRNPDCLVDNQAVFILDDISVLILLRPFDCVLEEIGRCGLLTLYDMASYLVRLVERIPAHVTFVEEKRGYVQHQGIRTAVISVGYAVACSLLDLPWVDASVEYVDDLRLK